MFLKSTAHVLPFFSFHGVMVYDMLSRIRRTVIDTLEVSSCIA
jgi:hypothetical protein